MIRSKRQDNLADFFLGILAFWSTSHIAGWMFGFAGWYDSRDTYSQFMFYYPFSNWFLLGPLLYFFVKAKTNSAFRLKRKDYKHFILPALSLSWVLICFFIDVIWKQNILGETLEDHGGTRGQFAQRYYGPLMIPLEILKYLSLFYYIYLSIKHYRAYRIYIFKELSIAEEVDIRWVRNILYAFTIAISSWFIFNLIGFLEIYSYQGAWWAYMFWGIMIFYIFISGYQDKSHIDFQLDFDPDAIEEEKVIKIENRQNIVLRTEVENGKYYLRPNLSLNDLAKALKIPAAELSKILNSDLNQNFNEFINEFRVRAFTQKLQQPEFSHYSILAIALECGFNSKATFNRVFKSQMGKSPSEYRKSLSP